VAAFRPHMLNGVGVVVAVRSMAQQGRGWPHRIDSDGRHGLTLRGHEKRVRGCGRVTPSFKGKTECIDHVCARIKLHTRLDIMNTKISATRMKSYYKP
jgi:hypothetical protein